MHHRRHVDISRGECHNIGQVVDLSFYKYIQYFRHKCSVYALNFINKNEIINCSMSSISKYLSYYDLDIIFLYYT